MYIELFKLAFGTFIVKVICGKSFCDFYPSILHPDLKAHNLICLDKMYSCMVKSLQFIPTGE